MKRELQNFIWTQIHAFFAGFGFAQKQKNHRICTQKRVLQFSLNSFFMLLFKIVVLIPVACVADQWPVPPDNISTPGVNASDQQIAIDANGNVVVVWIENGYVKSRSKPISGSWSATIDTLSNFGAEVPQVVLDDNGNAIALWSENGIIKAAGKPLEGSWTPSDTLSGTGASFPHIVTDSSGNAVAIWEENGFIKSATKLVNGSWPGTADTISNAGASSSQIGVGLDGTVV